MPKTKITDVTSSPKNKTRPKPVKHVFHPEFKLRRAYVLQALVVLGFVVVFAALRAFELEEARLMLPGIVGGIYFLVLRLVFHHVSLGWLVSSTLVIVAAVDFLIPLWFLGFEQTNWERTIQHLPIALVLASLEIFLEEEIEEFVEDD